MSLGPQFDALISSAMANPYFQRDRDREVHEREVAETRRLENLKAEQAAAARARALQNYNAAKTGGQYTPVVGSAAEMLGEMIGGDRDFGAFQSEPVIRDNYQRQFDYRLQGDNAVTPLDMMNQVRGSITPAVPPAPPAAPAPIAPVPDAPFPGSATVPGRVEPDMIGEWAVPAPAAGSIAPDTTAFGWREGLPAPAPAAAPAPVAAPQASGGGIEEQLRQVASEIAQRQRFPAQERIVVPPGASAEQLEALMGLNKHAIAVGDDVRGRRSAKALQDALVQDGAIPNHPGPMTSKDSVAYAKQIADGREKERTATTKAQEDAGKIQQYKGRAQMIKGYSGDIFNKLKGMVDNQAFPTTFRDYIGQSAIAGIRQPGGVGGFDVSGGTSGAGAAMNAFDKFLGDYGSFGVEPIKGILGDDFSIGDGDPMAMLVAKDILRRGGGSVSGEDAAVLDAWRGQEQDRRLSGVAFAILNELERQSRSGAESR